MLTAKRIVAKAGLRPELNGTRTQAGRLVHDPVGRANPLANQWPGVPGVDHLLELEPRQWTKWSARAFYARIEFCPQRFRIFGLGQLSLVRRFNAALRRDPADIRG